MIKKIMLILVVSLLVLFISGCDGNNSSVEVPSYNTGDLGITLELIENSPPHNAYHGGNIPFFLEIRNQGSYETNPLIWLSGHDPNIIRLNWNAVSPGLLEGKSFSNPIGGYGYLEAPNVNINLPNAVDTYSAPLKVTTCYSYVTKASAQVCVDSDATNNQDDACTPKTVSISGGQGGPVAITHIETEPSSSGTVIFTISIQDVGDGTIINEGKVNTCTSRMKASDIDVVSIRSAQLGYEHLSCTPSNPVRLVNGKGVVFCRKSGLSGSAYTTTINLELAYGYKSSISKSINVRRV